MKRKTEIPEGSRRDAEGAERGKAKDRSPSHRLTVSPSHYVPLRKAGAECLPPVTFQAVQKWIRDGFDKYKTDGRRKMVDVAALRAWQAKYRTDPDEPGHGGRRNVKGPKGQRAKDTDVLTPDDLTARPGLYVGDIPEDGSDPTRVKEHTPVPLTEAEIRERAKAGKLKKADLAQASDTFKVIDLIRDSEKRAGQTLDVAQCEEAWGSILQGHKLRLLEIPSHVEARACADLALTSEQGRKIREIARDEVAAVIADLLNAAWKPEEEPRRTQRAQRKM